MGWVEPLLEHTIGVDTAPFIYYTGENSNYINADLAKKYRELLFKTKGITSTFPR